MKKVFLLGLLLISFQSFAFKREIISQKKEQCFDSSGKEKIGSHCVCYTGKTACQQGEGTCSERRCEQWSCADDKDCAQISAKCRDHFCKLGAPLL